MILNFTIIIFALVNLLIYFAVRTRTSIIISLLISKLVMIFFFSQIIINHELFKEVIISLVIFAIAILILITSEFVVENDITSKLESNFNLSLSKISIIAGYGSVFLILFFLILKQDSIQQKFYLLQNQKIMQNNPSENLENKYSYDHQFDKLKNHQVNKDLANNFTEENYRPSIIDPKMIKQARFRDQLADNFLLKRSTHLIIAISGMLVLSLIFSNRNNL